MSILIKQNITLAPYTSFKIGGAAKYFCETENEEMLFEAIKKSGELNVPFFILGGGSNVLISDSGFDGMVIRIKSGNNIDAILTNGNIINARAGVLLGRIIDASVKASLSGLEFSAGIPGTLGGAIRGNAGVPEGTISDVIVKVRSMTPSGEIKERSVEDCQFAYRDSIFKHNSEIILSAELKFKEGVFEEISETIKTRAGYRINKQPLEFSSAGCVFKNVPALVIAKRFLEKFPIKNDKISVAYLISEVGLKGKRIGQAMVSEKHSNFIVNNGGASAENVLMLISLIKQRIADKFGIFLEEEIQYVGF